MKKLIHSIFLVSGTAIGAGLISLPLASANIGIPGTFLIILLSIFVAYHTSSVAITLNKFAQKGTSIVDLSKNISGKSAALISMLSFYMLSFALLSVYFSGTANIFAHFMSFDQNNVFLVTICGIVFLFLFSVKIKLFNKINSGLVVLLILSIIAVICFVYRGNNLSNSALQAINFKDVLYFLPIVFTSFGVQNICPYVFDLLEGDTKKIKLAFFIGILIPAIIYFLWICVVLISAQSQDGEFFQKILVHKVEAGELVKFLCDSSHSKFVSLFFQFLTLFAIVTSAIGIGIGLIGSLKEVLPSKIHRYIPLTAVIVPVLATIFVPNAFMSILSIGGIIATVFVIFMPLYLLRKIEKDSLPKVHYIICLLFGMLVIAAGFM